MYSQSVEYPFDSVVIRTVVVEVFVFAGVLLPKPSKKSTRYLYTHVSIVRGDCFVACCTSVEPHSVCGRGDRRKHDVCRGHGVGAVTLVYVYSIAVGFVGRPFGVSERAMRRLYVPPALSLHSACQSAGAHCLLDGLLPPTSKRRTRSTADIRMSTLK